MLVCSESNSTALVPHKLLSKGIKKEPKGPAIHRRASAHAWNSDRPGSDDVSGFGYALLAELNFGGDIIELLGPERDALAPIANEKRRRWFNKYNLPVPVDLDSQLRVFRFLPGGRERLADKLIREKAARDGCKMATFRKNMRNWTFLALPGKAGDVFIHGQKPYYCLRKVKRVKSDSAGGAGPEAAPSRASPTNSQTPEYTPPPSHPFAAVASSEMRSTVAVASSSAMQVSSALAAPTPSSATSATASTAITSYTTAATAMTSASGMTASGMASSVTTAATMASPLSNTAWLTSSSGVPVNPPYNCVLCPSCMGSFVTAPYPNPSLAPYPNPSPAPYPNPSPPYTLALASPSLPSRQAAAAPRASHASSVIRPVPLKPPSRYPLPLEDFRDACADEEGDEDEDEEVAGTGSRGPTAAAGDEAETETAADLLTFLLRGNARA